jgi:hypothetical protein
MRESRAAANKLDIPPQLKLTTATFDESRGDDPEELIRRIADFRAAEKRDPEYYARHTVMKALAQLGKLTPPANAATPDEENKQEREH